MQDGEITMKLNKLLHSTHIIIYVPILVKYKKLCNT